jgi:hypothetical protein
MVYSLIRSANPVGKGTAISKGDLVTNTEGVHILPDLRDTTGAVESKCLVVAWNCTGRDLHVLGNMSVTLPLQY